LLVPEDTLRVPRRDSGTHLRFAPGASKQAGGPAKTPLVCPAELAGSACLAWCSSRALGAQRVGSKTACPDVLSGVRTECSLEYVFTTIQPNR
jgi:hypothetical protein